MRNFFVAVLLLLPLSLHADDGFLGLFLKPLPDSTVQVSGLASGANAQKAGVKEGDIIVSFNGITISKSDQLVKAAKATAPGKTVKLRVKRDGKEQTFKVLIVSRQEFLGAGIEALKGKPIPELVGESVFSGSKVKVSQLTGKPLVLELWATWCPACVANIPRLDELARTRGSKVNVLGVAFEKTDVVKKFFADKKVAYDVVVVSVNDSSLKYLSNASIPKFIVADAAGTVVAITTSAAEADAVLEPLLK